MLYNSFYCQMCLVSNMFCCNDSCNGQGKMSNTIAFHTLLECSATSYYLLLSIALFVFYSWFKTTPNIIQKLFQKSSILSRF